MELIAYTYDPSEIRDLERQFRKVLVWLDGVELADIRGERGSLEPVPDDVRGVSSVTHTTHRWDDQYGYLS